MAQKLILHGCARCAGAIYTDEYGDRRCLQCGRSPVAMRPGEPSGDVCACGCGRPVKGLYQRPDGGWRMQRYVSGVHAMHPRAAVAL